MQIFGEWLIEASLEERLVVGAAWFVAMNVLPAGTAAEGQLVGRDPHNRPVSLVQLFDPPEIVT